MIINEASQRVAITARKGMLSRRKSRSVDSNSSEGTTTTNGVFSFTPCIERADAA